jgi:ribosomal protein L12E/L44/L45/RPP1/RPP2
MGIISRITSLLRRERPPATTSDEAPPPAQLAALKLFQVERDRASVVALCRRMVDEDTRADRVLKTLASDAARGGFQVKVKRGAGAGRARQVAADLIERLGLAEQIVDWVRLSARDGDSFLEIAVDADGLIQAVTRKPTLQIRRNCDDRDAFPDPTRAYWWADERHTAPPPDATWFADWQIIHARWDHDPERRYGRPLLMSARTAFRRFEEGEKDIAVRRKVRAGMRYLHQVEGDATAVEAYKAQNQAALNNPTAAVADFFVNSKASISTVQGDARLGEIGDVQHHISTFFIGSPVPKALVGYGEELNRDVLEEQKTQYDRALDGVTAWIDQQILQPLIELQWRLLGIWPGALAYEIIRPTRTPLTAAQLAAAGDAAMKLKAAGVLADALIIRFLAKVLPGLDEEEALQLLAAQRAAAAPPAPTGAPGSRPAIDPPPAPTAAAA